MTDTSDEMLTNQWFSALPAEEQEALIRRGEPITLHPGEFLFHRGDAPVGFYGIKSGRLKAFTLREDGKEAILAVIEAGNWFGQTSLTSRQPRLRVRGNACPVERIGKRLSVPRQRAGDDGVGGDGGDGGVGALRAAGRCGWMCERAHGFAWEPAPCAMRS